MHIISYRGPGKAGGVSAALMRLHQDDENDYCWWFIDGQQVKCKAPLALHDLECGTIPGAVIDGHYRYCNEFLWPIMHDLPQYAIYRLADHVLYDRLNKLLALSILRRKSSSAYFIQDYQFGLLPQCLKESPNMMAVFWHIPWPKHVPQEVLPPIIDLARGLLSAHFLGFHTKEYVENFLNFVERYIPDAHLRAGMTIEKIGSNGELMNASAGKNKNRTHLQLINPQAKANQTQLLVAPLGIDFNHWSTLADNSNHIAIHPNLLKTPLVLSVDRADYTKGVLNRLKGIEYLFERHPHLQGQLTFVQICGRTRPGLIAYDNYWASYKQQLLALNDRFGNNGWKPVITNEGPLSSAQLAVLYRQAKIMLVNPVRDGLNLAAKEYIACQRSDDPGVLLLSPNAGAWDELGHSVMAVNPNDPLDISTAIYAALNVPKEERRVSMTNLKEQLQRNSLQQWYGKFSNLLGEADSMDQALIRRAS